MKKIFLTISTFVLTASLLLFFPLRGEATNEVNVGLTVTNAVCGNGIIETGESCDDGVNNGPCAKNCSTSCVVNSCGGSSGPSIIITSSSVSNNTFYIKWSLSDTSGINSTLLKYGVSGYDISVAAVDLGGNSYEASITGLASSTIYQYQITAIDNSSSLNVSYYNGTFTTTAVVVVVDEPPVISNVTSTQGVTTAIIYFDTNELATSQILYGLTTAYGSNAVGSDDFKTSHSVILPNLLPDSTYHFKIVATDSANQSSGSNDFTFTTLADVVPPTNVSNFQITTTTNSIILNWINPADLDFSAVKILRGINSQITGPNDPAASLTHTTSGQTYTDYNVLANIDYYYSIFSFDTSGNYSSGVYKVGRTIQILNEVCGNGVDDDGNGKTDCADDVCKNLSSCIVPTEICNNGLDDDGDTKIDCDDSDCASSCVQGVSEICNNGLDDDGDTKIDCDDSDCSCAPGVTSEVCNNNLDDDGDTKIDCDDSDCFAYASCQVVGGVAVCENGLDDDSDGLVDYPSDPGCSASNDTDEYNAQIITIPDFARIDFNKLLFWAGNRQIILTPQNKIVTSLAGSSLTLGVPLSALNGKPDNLSLHLNDQDYLFSFSSSSEAYFTDVVFPIVGKHEAYLEINYGDNQLDSVLFYLNSLPKGEISGNGKALAGAEVVLMQVGGGELYLGVYGEKNPVVTDANGLYGWVVQNGEYYLEIKKGGFYTRTTPVFTVKNNVINTNVKLIKVAETVLESIAAASQLSIQKIGDVADNPVVEKTATEIVAPAVVGVTAVGTVAAVSWFNLLSLLRFVFLQPVMLFGKRKREKWGMVYNSLTKLPVDLAIVRLFDAETGRLVQTKVTDGQGRYAFVLDAGKYRLEVQKTNLVFPSALLKGIKSDKEKTDIYHGEVIAVAEKNSLITANIPLDPSGEEKTPRRIIREKFMRKLQTVLSWLGFVVTAVTLYISPVWYMWVLLGVHLFFLIVFKRIAKPKRAKGWGIVYDAETNRPVDRVVARLFDSQFNKLVATEVTSKNGKYHFLAGDSNYYVTYEHRDYEPIKLDIINSVEKNKGAIIEDIKIKKKETK